MKEYQGYFDANQKLWDKKTDIHIKSDFYDMKTFMSGESSLRKIETAELPNLNGKSLLHLQCHFGQDTLSLERRGADCTGVDLSENAIQKAREIRDKLGLQSKFVQCNVLNTDQHIHDVFDVVYTSYGTIIWLPDLDQWAEQVSKRLKSGGEFMMVEFHPTLYLFDWETDKIGYRYFNNGEPYLEESEGTYADTSADIKMKEYFWQHPLSDVMGSLMAQGLEITAFKEYDYSPYQLFDSFKKRAEQEYVYSINGINIPLIYMLKGRKK